MGETDRKTLRVAFIGASGTGKSTLAQYVSRVYGLPMNPVGSRSTAAAMGFSSPYDVDRASLEVYTELAKSEQPTAAATAAMARWAPGGASCRALFQRRLQQTKIAWELTNDRWVSDRTSVDDLCYMAMHDPRAVDVDFIATAVKHFDVPDVVFFTPVSAFIDTGTDPARVHDAGYHAIFEAMAAGFARWRSDVIWLWESELERRQMSVATAVEMAIENM